MCYDPKEINEVYAKVDELFRLKIKSHLKGTGLIFERFYHVTDLLTGKNLYNLTINKKVFGFETTLELYNGLLKIIKSEESETTEEIKRFEYHKYNDLNPDMGTISYNLDILYNRENKLSKLSEKLKNLIDTYKS